MLALVTGLMAAPAEAQTVYREIVDSLQVPGSSVDLVKGSVVLPVARDGLRCTVVLVSCGVSALL